MKIILLFLYTAFGSNTMGMDFIAKTRVEPYSLIKRDEEYRKKRDNFLRNYKMLYEYELLRDYPTNKDRDEQVDKIKCALEEDIVRLKNQLSQQWRTLSGGAAFSASSGISWYYSENPLAPVGLLCFLAVSAIYFEDQILWTMGDIRFKNFYLKKCKKLEMLKQFEIVTQSIFEENR